MKLSRTPARDGVTGKENVDYLTRLTNTVGGDIKNISISWQD